MKNPYLAAGGWAFEFHNNWYPDIDDSAVVLMALAEGLPEHRPHRTALDRGIDWCLGMQSENGGFAAFDTDNTKAWLNAIPFADLKALIDPPTEDVTGRVLEMMGLFGFNTEHQIASRAITYLKDVQEPDGCWYGRWGVNYIYGTWSVLCGLKGIGEDMSSPYIRRAVDLAPGAPERRRRLGRDLRIVPAAGIAGPGAEHGLTNRLGPPGSHGRRRSGE